MGIYALRELSKFCKDSILGLVRCYITYICLGSIGRYSASSSVCCSAMLLWFGNMEEKFTS